jgi:hypothetical protein
MKYEDAQFSEKAGGSHRVPMLYRTEGLPVPVRAIRYYLPVEIYSPEIRNSYHFCCCLFPGNSVWPVGYCSKGCPGHLSKADAREHYRQFLIDRFGQFNGRLTSSGICAVCGLETRFFGSIDYHYDWEIVPLCPMHLNREGLMAGFVFRDYHVLQVSDPCLSTAATISSPDCVISIVQPGKSGFGF